MRVSIDRSIPTFEVNDNEHPNPIKTAPQEPQLHLREFVNDDNFDEVINNNEGTTLS